MTKYIHKWKHPENTNGYPKYLFVFNELTPDGDWKLDALARRGDLQNLADDLADMTQKDRFAVDWTYTIPEQAPTRMTLSGVPYFVRSIVALSPEEIINFERYYLQALKKITSRF